ncbi:Exosome complex component RRP41 [Podochytrium sp. JEL0797]|nr:Exosome complex component RRP41 [Podochytrium sp. JEL0797]
MNSTLPLTLTAPPLPPPQWWFGGTASAIAGVATHPLDSLKVRLQTTAAGVTVGMLLSEIIQNEPGGLMVLYKGVDASMLRQLTYSSAKYAVYEHLKRVLTNTLPSPLLIRLTAASVAGIVGGVVGSPADLVNVRMQIDGKLPPHERRNYPNIVSGLLTIAREEGVGTMFSGVEATMLRAVLVTIGLSVTYDMVKMEMVSMGFVDGVVVQVVASLVGAFVATTICSPVDVIKSRIMAQAPSSREFVGGAVDTGVKIWRKEGFGAFFKGWVPSFVRLGPNSVITFVVLEWLEMGKSDVVSPEGFRIDGRRANELRRINIDIGASSFLPPGSAARAADGAAFVEQGNTRCFCQVFGPKEPSMRSAQLHDRATITVDFNIAAFSSGERKQKLRKDRRLLELASIIKSTFESVILTTSFPRSEITIQIQILQFDGGSLHVAINAATLALMNAGIPMTDYVVACSAGFGSLTPVLDVNYTEEGMDVPVVSVAVTPRSGKVVLLNLESRLHLDEFEKVLTLAKDGCMQMYEILDEAVRASAESLAR